MLPCEMLSGELSAEPVCAEAATNENDQARLAARQPAEQTSNRRRMRPPSRATRSRQQPPRALLHLAHSSSEAPLVSPSHYFTPPSTRRALRRRARPPAPRTSPC